MTRSPGAALGEVDPGEPKPVPDVRSEPVFPPRFNGYCLEWEDVK